METALALLAGVTIIASIITALDTWIRRNLSKRLGVRREAAEALGAIGDARAVEPLIRALGDSDGTVRLAAIEALGKLGDERAVEPLIQALQSDPDTGVRRAAVEALGQIGDKRAVEPLMAELTHE